MSDVSRIRDQWVRARNGYTEGMDIYAIADHRVLASRTAGEYKISVKHGSAMTAHDVRKPATSEDFGAQLGDVRAQLRADGWTLESSRDERP
jgi:hypothetical protein